MWPVQCHTKLIIKLQMGASIPQGTAFGHIQDGTCVLLQPGRMFSRHPRYVAIHVATSPRSLLAPAVKASSLRGPSSHLLKRETQSPECIFSLRNCMESGKTFRGNSTRTMSLGSSYVSRQLFLLDVLVVRRRVTPANSCWQRFHETLYPSSFSPREPSWS